MKRHTITPLFLALGSQHAACLHDLARGISCSVSDFSSWGPPLRRGLGARCTVTAVSPLTPLLMKNGGAAVLGCPADAAVNTLTRVCRLRLLQGVETLVVGGHLQPFYVLPIWVSEN